MEDGISVQKVNKKVIKRIIVACVCVVLAVGIVVGSVLLCKTYGVGVLNVHDRTEYAKTRELLSFREPFSAKYIWISDTSVAQWVAFSKRIDLPSDESEAVFDISCDTYYWLWINGEEIVWEGCLKRGVTPDDGFYDHIELKDKFKKGVNVVSVLVRHLGDDGFSHKDSGRGGFVLEGTIGDKPFLTDESWKAEEFAYTYSPLDFFKNLNFRLSERGSIVDGARYGEFWKEYQSGWKNAVALSSSESIKYFGKSYLNPLPQKVARGAKYFDISGAPTTFTKKTKMTFKLDVNKQFCPYFEFSADKQGRKVTYYTENRILNYKNEYRSKAGENRFLDFAWISGETLTVVFDKGITLKKIGYRATGYAADVVSPFTCEDEKLNVLWQKAVNTLLVTMRDSYMDCPDRERAEWIGDAVIESEMSFYSLTPESSALFRKAIVTTYGWAHRDGVIQTVVPDGVNAYELPVQNLAFLVGCADYVTYSGDTTVLPMVLSLAERYLPLFDMKDGLIVHRKGSWDWGDWGSKIDMAALENAWYYYAMKKLLPFVPKESALYSLCSVRMESIEKGYQKFYKSFGISSGSKPDDRANAIAVLAGLYPQERVNEVIDVLFSVRNSSPYMEKYVEQALCVLGRLDLALTRAKEVYSDMIEDDCSTLWEFWRKRSGTTNHAWSGGSLLVLSRDLAGIRPTDLGFSSFEVAPDTSVLQNYSLTVHPVDGVEIFVKAEKLDEKHEKITVVCSSDGGTLKVDGKNFVFNGVPMPIGWAGGAIRLSKGVNELVFER